MAKPSSALQTLSCRRGARLCQSAPLTFAFHTRRASTKPSASPPLSPSQLDDLLSTPSWSMNDLLPSATNSAITTSEVSRKKLHHLLRLSALPPPSSPEEESTMLSQLHQQLHFVRQIQNVANIEKVWPLARIQDETRAAEGERTHDLEGMKGVLEGERWVGRWNRRVRKGEERDEKERRDVERWDVLGQAPRRVGGFFVVEGGGTTGKEEG